MPFRGSFREHHPVTCNGSTRKKIQKAELLFEEAVHSPVNLLHIDMPSFLVLSDTVHANHAGSVLNPEVKSLLPGTLSN
jgi:hypothetical protein